MPRTYACVSSNYDENNEISIDPLFLEHWMEEMK